MCSALWKAGKYKRELTLFKFSLETSEMAAQVLMKRGKRTLATQIKVECCRQNGQQLKELLDFLLAPSRQIDDFDTLDWCRWLIAGGHTFDEFSKTGVKL